MNPLRSEHGEGASPAESAWRRAALAHERADRAEASVARQERLLAETGQAVFAHLAEVQRRSAACHRSSARLQESFARKTEEWERDKGKAQPPRFMTGVAEACGVRSAALVLVGPDQAQLSVAASDEHSRSAQDLEYVLGEGPIRDVAAERTLVLASGEALERRWPRYGPALNSLGIASVAAAPLIVPGGCFGGLAVFDPQPGLVESDAFAEIVAALGRLILHGSEADRELYGGADYRPTVQQAAGMLSVRADCSVTDALALIKARAFTEEVTAEAVARRIVRGDLHSFEGTIR
ncbi:GAF and ANTAR domain-containing protein [Streptomyces tsukubensis]|uniref:GAF domain-containing protein n=1 Tax=Streptomyces tsukubensis TaxID=83656 RepID=A0A1V4A8U0_9ACTN|nr:ANTAR domain-containing protein [Streptomyces tsukubensis]OON78774.1 GAF domain-containing protein [Streptomyces tsukubensis]QFR94253.1 GAF domain-containing protein [Streptomyces tsukubensis]